MTGMDNNPYNAPRSPLYGTARAPRTSVASFELEPAGKGRRFANVLIDSFAYFGLQVGFLFLMVLTQGPQYLQRAQHMSVLESYLTSMLILLFYYVLTERLFGCTLGKLITGTRVVDENGDRPGTVQIVLRTLIRFVPFEAFSVAFSSDGRGWHDRWSQTCVVRTA